MSPPTQSYISFLPLPTSAMSPTYSITYIISSSTYLLHVLHLLKNLCHFSLYLPPTCPPPTSFFSSTYLQHVPTYSITYIISSSTYLRHVPHLLNHLHHFFLYLPPPCPPPTQKPMSFLPLHTSSMSPTYSITYIISSSTYLLHVAHLLNHIYHFFLYLPPPCPHLLNHLHHFFLCLPPTCPPPTQKPTSFLPLPTSSMSPTYSITYIISSSTYLLHVPHLHHFFLCLPPTCPPPTQSPKSFLPLPTSYMSPTYIISSSTYLLHVPHLLNHLHHFFLYLPPTCPPPTSFLPLPTSYMSPPTQSPTSFLPLPTSAMSPTYSKTYVISPSTYLLHVPHLHHFFLCLPPTCPPPTQKPTSFLPLPTSNMSPPTQTPTSFLPLPTSSMLPTYSITYIISSSTYLLHVPHYSITYIIFSSTYLLHVPHLLNHLHHFFLYIPPPCPPPTQSPKSFIPLPTSYMSPTYIISSSGYLQHVPHLLNHLHHFILYIPPTCPPPTQSPTSFLPLHTSSMSPTYSITYIISSSTYLLHVPHLLNHLHHFFLYLPPPCCPPTQSPTSFLPLPTSYMSPTYIISSSVYLLHVPTYSITYIISSSTYLLHVPHLLNHLHHFFLYIPPPCPPPTQSPTSFLPLPTSSMLPTYSITYIISSSTYLLHVPHLHNFFLCLPPTCPPPTQSPTSFLPLPTSYMSPTYIIYSSAYLLHVPHLLNHLHHFFLYIPPPCPPPTQSPTSFLPLHTSSMSPTYS